MKTSPLRQVIVALTIAVSAATVHGAWFASTDARETAPFLTISTWDFYEKSWVSTQLDLGGTEPTLRHSEDTIVAITGTPLSLPSGLNAATLDEQALATLEIPLVVGATQYLHLLVSKPANLAGTWPVLDPENPWSGPNDPTDADLGALDVDGSVGVHTVSVDGAPFTWDIGRWSKGDIFLGLNNHTYKVLDRNGNFKRFVASADYDEYHNDAQGDDYNVTTGCATNWKTGEVFATNFADYYPAINVIGRQPVDSDLSPYSQASRRILTRINRTDDALTEYANPYTSVNYPIDSSPESVAFDADMNMYVGHSFGNFRQVPAAWAERDEEGNIIGPVAGKIFEFDDQWTEYTMAVDGLPLEGWSWDDGWGWVVDETGVRMLLAPAGSTAPDDFTEKRYGVDVSPRLSYNADGSLKMATTGDFYPAVVGLPDWNPAGELPQSFLSDPETGAALYRRTDVSTIVEALIPTRWSMGKRLHRYAQQDGAYLGSEGVAGESGARREAFWTFSGRQGTDWIDLDVTGGVMYYTSEDSFIHRYRVKPGPNGEAVGQLPDVGANLVVNGVPTYGKLAVAQNAELAIQQGGGLLSSYRFHGMRILPPGDGTGGFLVAVENGLGVHRFNRDGKWVQRYWAYADSNTSSPDGTRHLIANWYTLEVDPGGRTFWASAHDTGKVFQFDIASGRILKTIDAVQFRAPLGDDAGRRVEGICIMWEYTAPQEICFKADGTPDGVDDDGDGYVDENCVAIEVCSAVSDTDDDGDDLPDQYDSDCSPELPPVAIDDAYALHQQDPTQPTLSVDAANGVLKLGPVADYDRDSGTYADLNALKVVSFGVAEGSVTAVPGASVTTAGNGTVVLQEDGSFLYTPDPSFHGVDSFAYKVTDGYPLSPDDRDVPNDGQDDLATVTITVAPKVANDGTFSLWVGETLSMGGLLTNDPAQSTTLYPVTISEAGPSGTPVAFAGSRTFQTSQSNSVTVNADGSFTFTASNLAYGGPDEFIYAVHDTASRSWNLATVAFDVKRPVITVVVPDQIKPYDGAPLPTTCAVTSDRVADPVYTLTYTGTIRGGATYGPTETAPTAAGTYTATCTHNDLALGPQTDTGSIVINPVPLTVTAGDTARPYLAANPVVTRQITGFVNSETESVLGGITTCSTSTAQSANVGTYPDANTCSQTLSATNYTFSYVPGDLAITGFVLTVKASDTEKSYGDPNPPVTYTITGFQGGEDATVVNGSTTCGTTGGPNAGSYAGANTCTPTLTATNYSFVYEPGTLVINKAPLVVTASATTKVYGDANPPVLRTITGFTNGDDAGDLGGSSVCSTAASAGPNVGAYPQANTCTENLTSLNYTFTYEPGTLTISPAPLVVTADDKSKLYDGLVFPGPYTVTYNGFVPGDDASDLGGALTFSGAAGSAVNAGTYTDGIVPAGYTATNYTITYEPGTLTISPAPLVVTADDKSKLYDGQVYSGPYTVTYNGFVSGENQSALGGALTFSGAAATAVNVGTYTNGIVPAGYVSTNYAISYVPGTLRIDPPVLIVTAEDKSKLYDGTGYSPFTVTYSGFVGDDDPSDLGGALTFSGAATTAVNVGTYTDGIVPAGYTSSNYTITYVPGTLTISPAPLVVTADDKSKLYDGLVFPGPYTVTYNGFVPGDDASDLGGALTFSGAAGSAVNAGTYTDGIVPAGYTATNYTITYEPGTLTISPAPLVVTADDKSKPYDGQVYPGPYTVTYSGFVNDEDPTDLGGALAFSGAALAAVNSGTYTDGIVPAGYTSTNYTISYMPGTLRVDPPVLIITAEDKTKTYDGTVYSPFTVSYSGFVGDDDVSDLGGALTFSGAATTAVNAGTYTAGIVPAGYTSTNYTIQYVAGTLAITPVPLVVTADDKSKLYDRTVYSPFTVTYSGFVGGDDVGDLGGALTYSGAATTAVNVGTYTDGIVPAGYTSTNYTITYEPGTLVINPIPATLRANDKSMYEGDPVPALDGAWTGLLPGDVAGATYSTTGTSASPVGTYPITPTPDNSPVLANYIVTVAPGTLTILPRVVPCAATGYTTYSQGGWGSKPSGNNPGALLKSHFATVYPNGVAIGGTHKLSFTSASAIEKFLPAGGPSKVLTTSATNPAKSPAGVFAGQLLALQLAADFSAAGKLQIGLGAMVMQSGTMAGKSVNEILAIANQVLGGNTAALPSGMSISGLSSLLESIIMNYHEGADRGLLACGSGNPPPPPPANRPPVAHDDSATTVTTTPVSVSVLGNDSDPDGDAVTVVPTGYTQPANGSVTLSNNVFTFVAVSGFTGTTTFTYTITDGKGGTDAAVVTIIVTGGTPPPPPPTGSGVCEGGVTKLVLKYVGTSPLSGVVFGQRTAPGRGSKLGAQVSGSSPLLYTFAIKEMGGLFDSVSSGRLANEFTVFVGNTRIGEAHTSCSVPIYPGMKIGSSFEIVEVWSKGGGLIVRPPTN